MYVLYYNAIFHSHLGVFLLPHGSVTLLLLHLCVAGASRTILTALDARRDVLLGLFFPKKIHDKAPTCCKHVQNSTLRTLRQKWTSCCSHNGIYQLPHHSWWVVLVAFACTRRYATWQQGWVLWQAIRCWRWWPAPIERRIMSSTHEWTKGHAPTLQYMSLACLHRVHKLLGGTILICIEMIYMKWLEVCTPLCQTILLSVRLFCVLCWSGDDLELLPWQFAQQPAC